jgi:hypothetical protein
VVRRGILAAGKIAVDPPRATLAIGKKNWLFRGEAGTGQRGAIIDTLMKNTQIAEATLGGLGQNCSRISEGQAVVLVRYSVRQPS